MRRVMERACLAVRRSSQVQSLTAPLARAEEEEGSEGEKPVLSLEDANPAWRLQGETRALGCCQRELRWKQGTCFRKLEERGLSGPNWSSREGSWGSNTEPHRPPEAAA